MQYLHGSYFLLQSAEEVGQIIAFLKWSYKYGFCTKLFTVEGLSDDAD